MSGSETPKGRGAEKPEDQTPRRDGLSLLTLMIASVAATVAALITSRLWAHGAIFSTALTPLIVALVSEGLRRPANRVTRLRRSHPHSPGEPASVPEKPSPASGPAGPTTHHYRGLKITLVTAGCAFVIAVGALTVPELILGGSHPRTTLFGGQRHAETVTQTVPAATATLTAPTLTSLTTTTTRATTTRPKTTTAARQTTTVITTVTVTAPTSTSPLPSTSGSPTTPAATTPASPVTTTNAVTVP